MPKREQRTSLRTWARSTLWVSFGAIVVSIVCFGGMDSRAWVPVCCCLFLFFAGLLLALLRSRRTPPWHWLLAPTLGFGLFVALQWQWHWSLYPGGTLTGELQLAGCGCLLYLALFTFRYASNIRLAGAAIWILTGAIAAEAIAQYFTAFRYVYWYRPAFYATPIGPFIYHNHFAGCMDLLLPIAVAAAFGTRGTNSTEWLRHFRRGIVPALGLIAVVMSQSRGGALAVAIEGLAAAALSWRQLKSSRQLQRKVSLAALLLLGFVLLAAWGPVIRRFSDLGSSDASVKARVEVALSCLAIWRDRPWTGSGFNTFATVYPQYQRFDDGKTFLYAHDEYAQALAETGLVGAVCVIGFLAALLVECRRSWDTGAPGEAILYKKAAFVACVGFLFHAAIDFQFHAFANALLFFFVVGLAASQLTVVPRHRCEGSERPEERTTALRVAPGL